MNRILSNPIILAVFSLIFVAFFFSLRKSASKTMISTQNISIIEDEIKALEEKINKSKEELELTKQPIYKEKIMRNELLMQKEGEYVVQLPDLEKREVENVEDDVTAWEEWGKLIF